MNCGVVIRTECCKSNCSKEQTDDDDDVQMMDEYEEGSADEEELDKASVKTVVKFPDEWRP